MIGGTELKVGIGDMKFSRGEGRIITYALGSCIGITFYDPVTVWEHFCTSCFRHSLKERIPIHLKFADSGHQGKTLRKLKNIRVW